jgi:hypothetical protein
MTLLRMWIYSLTIAVEKYWWLYINDLINSDVVSFYGSYLADGTLDTDNGEEDCVTLMPGLYSGFIRKFQEVGFASRAKRALR